MSTDAGNPKFKEYRGKARDWLMGEGWKIGEAAGPDVEWALVATDAAQRNVAVAQVKNRPDVVHIQAGVALDAEAFHRVQSAPAQEREKLFYDLRLSLLGRGLEFAGISDPFQAVAITQRIYGDGFTRDTFMQRVSQVRDGVVIALLKIAQFNKQELPPEAPERPPVIGFSAP
jgi:hypothetical protein